MEIKLFGKSLFKVEKANAGWALVTGAPNAIKESKFLMDFFKGFGRSDESRLMDRIQFISDTTQGTLSNSFTSTTMGIVNDEPTKKPEVKKDAAKKELTPKEVHTLKLLHDGEFKLNTDEAYVDEQVKSFKDKLALIKSEEYDMRNGVNEIASILQRLENRKKYCDVKTVFEEFPYTTTSKIGKVIEENDYLKMGQVAQFLADMPKEAVDAMKRYNEGTQKLCGKQAVFYIVANKKDFEKSDKRRDPILLAQSPFGHFWQILGAWDEEMIFLEQL